MEKIDNLLDKIVSLCKRRGFVYPSAEIYGGFAGFWDYGPYGLALKNNIKQLWWKMFVMDRDDMYGVDAAQITKHEVLQASGHVSGFSDPLADGSRFNTMFRTSAGAGEETATAYLRPETAQGIFTNFKNIIDSFHPSLPFGIAQIGKAFRNEISPRDFIFRAREFEQMEVEYFVKPDGWREAFGLWQKKMHEWIDAVGIDAKKVYELEVTDNERAHYSKRTIDFEFDFPFGRKELYGLAYRTDYDLSNHAKASGVELSYLDEETKTKITPHVIEPSLGVDRTVLAVLCSAYTEDEMNGEPRIVLKLKPAIAPVKVAVFPLLKNKPELVKKAREIFRDLKISIGAVVFDDNGNIGKRYRRQDEIGTPFCVTVDFDSLEKGDVTVRARDTGKQERIPLPDLSAELKKRLG
ncbi:MAG: glycyl-tRNA synthetase [Parcubacteria group bacterium Gr01-1014_17]|nr:MAG: glycyl-tRNA synthetase [Parcubacteria group bacterium Gr01-1014_17]